jgi:hypothetical protein
MAGFDDIGRLPLNEKHNFYARLRRFEADRQTFLRSFAELVNNPAISVADKWDETEATSSAVVQIAKMAGVVRA